MEWKWSTGEPYERSQRPMKKQEQEEGMVPDEHFSREIEETAYSTSLNHDENTWDILNQHIYQETFRETNKREELHDKMATRERIQQIGVNPFLNQTNYVEDISIRDQFMKPMNTTQDRVKHDFSLE